jgi:hypothetical protein
MLNHPEKEQGMSNEVPFNIPCSFMYFLTFGGFL